MKSEMNSTLLPPGGFAPETEDVVEVPLLLSTSQVSALERAAHRRGVTAAEMLRQLLRACLPLTETSF